MFYNSCDALSWFSCSYKVDRIEIVRKLGVSSKKAMTNFERL